MKLMGVAMCEGEVREIPKCGMNFEEVCFCFGSPQLATDLRMIEALVPAKSHGRVLLFDRKHVEDVWARYVAGDFDSLLEQRRARK